MAPSNNIEDLPGFYDRVRQRSLALVAPLEAEDYQVQPMADASPPKWHLAHVTWFFETFILSQALEGYRAFHPDFEQLFNSYYNGVGEPYPRAARGFLSRPTTTEVLAYRQHVDDAMQRLMAASLPESLAAKIVLGLNHEQQHQELLLTDLKCNLGQNPLKPAYRQAELPACQAAPMGFVEFAGGECTLGAPAGAGFAFDNEGPAHQALLRAFQLGSRPVTNGEYLAFIEDGGYERHELWLSDAWAHLKSLGDARWQAPLYWSQAADGSRSRYALTGGEAPLDLAEPVCHLSAYEADAYARWRGCRLPTEAEWEHAASSCALEGHFAGSGRYQPGGIDAGPGGPAPESAGKQALHQMFGDVWEWTSSSYSPYPGFKPWPGQLGEYNGKFMANQLVLRGGSCATPEGHIRATYRNFFYPKDRWQFAGVRLARDL